MYPCILQRSIVCTLKEKFFFRIIPTESLDSLTMYPDYRQLGSLEAVASVGTEKSSVDIIYSHSPNGGRMDQGKCKPILESLSMFI